MSMVWFEASAVARRRSDAGRRAKARRRPILGRFRLWRRRAKERAELAALSERMLADIGLSRAEAEFLSNKPFWRD